LIRRGRGRRGDCRRTGRGEEEGGEGKGLVWKELIEQGSGREEGDSERVYRAGRVREGRQDGVPAGKGVGRKGVHAEMGHRNAVLGQKECRQPIHSA
jgi:hypothetical protein